MNAVFSLSMLLLYPQSYCEWTDMKGLKHQIRLDKTVSNIPSNSGSVVWIMHTHAHTHIHTHTHSANHLQCHSFRQHLSPTSVASLGLVTQGTLKIQRHHLCDSDGLQHTRIIQWVMNYCLWINWWFMYILGVWMILEKREIDMDKSNQWFG